MWKCLIHRQYSLDLTCFINYVLEMFLPTSLLVGLHEAWIPSYIFFLKKNILEIWLSHQNFLDNEQSLWRSEFWCLIPIQTPLWPTPWSDSSLTKLFTGFQQVASSRKPTSSLTHLSIPWGGWIWFFSQSPSPTFNQNSLNSVSLWNW